MILFTAYNIRVVELESMLAEENVSETIHFKEISELVVEPKTSDGVGVIVLERGDFCGVSYSYQPLLGQLVTQLLILK